MENSVAFTFFRRTSSRFGRLLILLVLFPFIFRLVSGTLANSAEKTNPLAIESTLETINAATTIYWNDLGSGSVPGENWRMDLSGGGPELLTDELARPRGIVLDEAAGHIYWVDRNTGWLQRSNLDGSAVVTLKSGLNAPDDVALDLVNGYIYVVENGRNQIIRLPLNGGDAVTMLGPADGITSPVGIALDTANNRLYFTEYGAGRVWVSALDGSNLQLLASGLWGPLEPALDVGGGYLYVTDSLDEGSGRIVRIALNTGIVQPFVTGLTSPRGIDLDLMAGHLYWSDWGTRTLERINLSGGGRMEILSGGNALNSPRSIALAFAPEPPECYALQLSHSGLGSDPTAFPGQSPGCESGEFSAGTAITLQAIPANGWEVAGWSGTNNDGSTASTNNATMPAANHTVAVHYTEIPGTATPTQTPTLEPTVTPTATSTPPTPVTPTFAEGLYLPVTIFIPCHHLLLHEREPNDRPEEAIGPLCFNRQYTGYPDDRDDYYFFQVDTTAATAIELANITGRSPQLQLYRGTVSAANLVQSVGPGPYVINRILTPERYYLRVFVGGDYNSTTLYTLRIQR